MPQVSVKRFRATFKSAGNPDFGQYAPISDPEAFEGATVDEVVKAYRAYCVKWQMGGGNECKIVVKGMGRDSIVGFATAFVIFSGQACHPTEREREFDTPRPLTTREKVTLDGRRLTGDEPSCPNCLDLLVPAGPSPRAALICQNCIVCSKCNTRTGDWRPDPVRGLAFALCVPCHDGLPPRSIHLHAYYYPRGAKVPRKGQHPRTHEERGMISAHGPVGMEAAVRKLLAMKEAAFRLEKSLSLEPSDGTFVYTESREK